MSGHTPGPWFAIVRKSLGRTPTVDVVGPRKRGRAGPSVIVAWTGFDSCDVASDQWEPNARLIAAAPDLLAALRRLTALTDPEASPTRESAYNQAVDAIDKAEGQ